MGLFTDFVSDLKVAYHLIKPTHGDTHQERLENFYQGQAKAYDKFRKRLLHGREELYKKISTHGGEVWLDFGGGTGANLEPIAAQLTQFRKIYIVDLCPSLLEIANQRIAEHDWKNVEAIASDVTQFVPPEGFADIITFSYSLTMIPNWFAAIDQAYKLLKPGGVIGVTDFYVSRKYPPVEWRNHSWLTRHFWTIWFSTDNVFLSPEHAPYLHHHFNQISFTENMATVPLLPGLKVPYYQFIGRKEK
jgi:S-adenosylmethionine-diacylgycerolhomoserine-N-methlytransferase